MAVNSFTLPTSGRGGDQHPVTELEVQHHLKQEFIVRTPSLYSLLNTYGPFPQYSLVVGVRPDGLPFTLALDKPRSGAILIIGGNNIEKSQILRSICLSACLINHPAEVSMSLITNKADQYIGLQNYPHCQRIISPYERSAGELVNEFASLVEQRRSGKEHGGGALLSDYSVYLNLKTLVINGPGYGVWPIISIEPEDVRSSKGQLLRSFDTYIFERIKRDPGLPAFESTPPSDLIYEPNFDVIIEGRLTPISNILV
jgi:hypothetical protein